MMRADDGALASADPCDDVKLEDTDGAPVDAADDHRIRANLSSIFSLLYHVKALENMEGNECAEHSAFISLICFSRVIRRSTIYQTLVSSNDYK